MGLDKQNVNRGKCTEVDCKCPGYERIGDGNRCSFCRHVAVKHVAIHAGTTGSHKAATNVPAYYSEDLDVKMCYRCSSQYSSSKHGACITCYPRDQCSNRPECTELAYYDKDLGSFNYCSRECRDKCDLKEANEELRRALKEFEVVPGLQISSRAPEGRSTDEKICDHGVRSTYIGRGVTMNITGDHQPTPYASSRSNPSALRSTSSTWSKPSTSHTTSSTWRNLSTSPTTGSTGSNQSSPHTTSNMSVGSASQPTTSTGTIMSQSDSSSTITGNLPVVVSHQRSSQTIISQPQSLSQNSPCCFIALSVPASILNSSNTTFYSSMKGMDIHRNTGILVSAVTLDGESCKLRPLDLVTHIDKKAIKDKIGCDGRVSPIHLPTSGEVWLTVQRGHHIPPVEELKMSFFDGENVPRTSLGIYTFKLAAVSCTSKDLKECATFLGINVEGGAGYGSKKISRVSYGSLGWDIGLTMLHTIVSVAMVTTEKEIIGPEPNWSFETIKSAARENSGICALLLLLRKY